MKLVFLGSGGGRFSTISQKRMSGGFRIENLNGKSYHVDPGPGALVRTYQFGLNPRSLDGVFVTHAHTDHYNDAEILIESMTNGMTIHNGVIVGGYSVFDGYKNWGPCISKYHRSKSRNVILYPNHNVNIDEDINVKGCATDHGDPSGVGFQIKTNNITLSYTSDTKYFDGLVDYHQGADILIGSVLRPGSSSIKGHMSTESFTKLVDEVKPQVAIITHFGLKMLSANPVLEAKYIHDQTGVKSLAAFDGMSLEVDYENIYKSHFISLRDEKSKLFKIEKNTVREAPSFGRPKKQLYASDSFKKDFNA